MKVEPIENTHAELLILYCLSQLHVMYSKQCDFNYPWTSFCSNLMSEA